ncbi:MAG: hypothetical protein LBH37_04240 [Oscillospiraceae bacterium]|nr:hypothetical protein [Oscillospiraceae bacterium]
MNKGIVGQRLSAEGIENTNWHGIKTPTIHEIGASPGCTIEVFEDSNLLGRCSVREDNSFEITVSELSSGIHLIATTKRIRLTGQRDFYV